jgi:hypothetical protein
MNILIRNKVSFPILPPCKTFINFQPTKKPAFDRLFLANIRLAIFLIYPFKISLSSSALDTIFYERKDKEDILRK